MNKDESKIPEGFYCYDENGVCPYWKHIKTTRLYEDNAKLCQYRDDCNTFENNECGVSPSKTCTTAIIRCEYLEFTDIDEDSLLWDQCKECNIKCNL